VWEASPQLVVKGGYGHAFKAPTLKQISPNLWAPRGRKLHGQRQHPARNLQLLRDRRRLAGQQDPCRCAPRLHTEVTPDHLPLLQQIGPRRIYQYDNVDSARIQGWRPASPWH
jgi:outer membrane receptor for ferrienterochelin and colicins